MSRSKYKHKQERKRRHERQILEGTRQVRKKIKKKKHTGDQCAELSSLRSTEKM